MSTYGDLEREYTQLITQWKDKHSIFSLGHVDDVFALTTELLRQQKKKMNQEQEILMKTRGVFKEVISFNGALISDYITLDKTESVQVGYLDLDDNVVFNEVDSSYVQEENRIYRYLPGFKVRSYRSWEDYVPINNQKEIREVVSTITLKYCPNRYGTGNTIVYPVVGYLDDNNQLVYYHQISDKK